MTNRTNTRTDLDMIASGAWVKIGDKQYQHASGKVVAYDHNNWGWRIDGGRECYKALGSVRYRVEVAA